MSRDKSELNDNEKSELADLVTGFALGFEQAQAKFDLEEDVLVDLLLDMNIERCPTCGWCVDSHELIPPDSDDTPDGHCRNCR